ncbi:serpin family protein [Telluribacter sp.]|jgi:serpin B|uniref:serpin family protein n=1 Tax=Telluribacter sp. TaxID=1978767 RepID=UPI002E153045|nr:serpin family protein [Telluribacter sp.]
MNKIFTTAAVTAALITVSLSGCDNNGNTPAPIEGKEVRISARVAANTTDFAFDFFKNLQSTQPAGDNIFVSPLSLHIALGMLLNGAEGETARQIQQTLKLEGLTQAELNQAYQALMEGLPQADPSVKLALANSVWYRNTFQVEKDFLNVLKQSFKAEVSAENFDSPAAKDRINQWASDNTNGKIKKVIDEIRPEHVMFLLNALYFKGDWKYQFDPKQTMDAPFTLANGGTKNVKMMSLKENYRVARTEKYTAAQLPYSTGQFNLTLLMPNEGATVNDLIAGFTAEEWTKLQSSLLQESKVLVGLPKFTLEYEVNLNKTLQKMGMDRVFTAQAELDKISKAEQLAVSFIKQNTYLGVDEKGTEAAAVTTIGIEVTSAPPSYIFDRPFVFIISEKSSDTILFMGRIMNP